jgi:hypothetical protein
MWKEVTIDIRLGYQEGLIILEALDEYQERLDMRKEEVEQIASLFSNSIEAYEKEPS